jgi:hypothetical protein
MPEGTGFRNQPALGPQHDSGEQTSLSRSAATPSTASQLEEDVFFGTAGVATGSGAAVPSERGQNRSLNPKGRAFRMVPLSRSRRLPRLVILIPSARTRLAAKLRTIGAAIDNTVEAVVVRKPDAASMASVTAAAELPKRLGRKRLPLEIKGELGSEAAWAIWDRAVSSDAPGARSNIVRNAWESSDLLAIPLSGN